MKIIEFRQRLEELSKIDPNHGPCLFFLESGENTGKYDKTWENTEKYEGKIRENMGKYG